MIPKSVLHGVLRSGDPPSILTFIRDIQVLKTYGAAPYAAGLKRLEKQIKEKQASVNEKIGMLKFTCVPYVILVTNVYLGVKVYLSGRDVDLQRY